MFLFYRNFFWDIRATRIVFWSRWILFFFFFKFLEGYFNYHWCQLIFCKELFAISREAKKTENEGEKEKEATLASVKVSQIVPRTKRSARWNCIVPTRIPEFAWQGEGRGIGLELSLAKHRKSRQPECRALNPAKFPQKERADGPNDCLLESNQRRG